MHVRPCSSALHTYIHLDPRLTFSSFWSCYFCQEYISTKQNTAEYIWSLQFHDNVLYNYLGMWPAAMFGSTYNVGNQADWGGEVYSPVGQPIAQLHQWVLAFFLDPVGTQDMQLKVVKLVFHILIRDNFM